MSENKSELPVVTIGICTHNERDNISNALNSCLDCDYPKNKLEIIVVDDSDDGTDEIIQEFVKKNKNIRFYTLNKIGKAAAINTVLKRSTGDVIVFFSGDCIINRDSLKFLIGGFDNGVGGTTGRKFVRNKKKMSHIISHILWRIHHKLSLVNPKMCGDLCAIKRGFIDEIPENTINDDAYIDAIIKKKGINIQYVPKAIVEIQPYKNFYQYFKVRRRILRGYMQIKENGLSSGFSFLDIVRVTLQDIFKNFKYLPFYIISIFIEVMAFISAQVDLRRDILPYSWK